MMRIISKIGICLLLLSTMQCKENNERVDPSVTLSQDLEEIHKNGNLNGFSVAIVNTDSIIYSKGIGLADIKTNRAYTANTIQNIASISKTLIGIALLKAEEDGFLSLDDPINKHLDFKIVNPYFPNDSITIRQLTTHTSSIIDGDIYDEKSYILKSEIASEDESIERPESFNAPSEHTSMKSFLQAVLSKDGEMYSEANFLNTKPGSTFDYSNIGATLAALVIESATGEDYRTYTTKHILNPLKMSQSGWDFNEVNMNNHSRLYSNKTKAYPFYHLITYPDGGLRTSANDLSLFLMELIKGYSGEGQIINKESFKTYFRPQLDDSHYEERDAENPYNDEYNYGVFIGHSAKDYIGHTGGDPGVTTFMFFNTKTKIGRLMLINTDLNSDDDVQQLIAIWDKLRDYQDIFLEE